jgi:hypothetical protein
MFCCAYRVLSKYFLLVVDDDDDGGKLGDNVLSTVKLSTDQQEARPAYTKQQPQARRERPLAGCCNLGKR